MSEIKLLIIEDEAIIAHDIAELCELLGYTVVDTAHSAGQALQAIDQHALDLVLLDINLEDEIDGIEIAEYISEKKGVPFIYLTSYADMDTLSRAKKTNPMGYIVKPFNKDQLLSTIEVSLHNHTQMKVPGGLDMEKIQDAMVVPMSKRERIILQWIYKGKTNKQMAELEHISVNTVKYYIKQLYSKLDVNSRSSLLAKIRDIQR